MTEFDTNDRIVQQIWDRLRTLIGAKARNIKSREDLAKVARRYKTLSGYEKSGLLKKSNIFEVIREKKMQTLVRGYTKNGKEVKGYYREVTYRWTKKENAQLKVYVSRGRTINQIAHYLSRSPRSVQQKIYKAKKSNK